MPRGDAWSRTILFCGVDSFRIAVHERDDPTLRGAAVALVTKGRRAQVVARSSAARPLGVELGALVEDLQADPRELRTVPVQPPLYREANRALTAIFRRFAGPERLEAVDLGATYLDVTTRTRHGTSTPEEVARRLRFMVQDEIGLSMAIGVSTGKFVARIAGTSRGPDAVTIVRPGEEADFLAPLSLSLLGERDQALLSTLGLRTLGDLAAYDTVRLVEQLGTRAALLQRLAQGRDREPVENGRAAKTISAETTFTQLVDRPDELDQALAALVRRITDRLESEAVRARTIYVKLQLADLRAVSRQVSRSVATDQEAELLASARAALRKCYVAGTRVKLLGVGLSGLEHPRPDYQLPLFS